MKTVAKNFILTACLAIALIFTFVMVKNALVPAFASDVHFASDVQSIYDTATQATSEATDFVYGIALAVCPLSLIVVLLLIMISRDSKKVAGLISIAGTICLATGGIILVKSEVAIKIIESIVNMFTK